MKSWSKNLVATKLADQCPNYVHKFDYFLETPIPQNSEDCLYLNIYVPLLDNGKKKPTRLLPVLFWIHSDEMLLNRPDYFGVKYIMDKNVILITVNYRMGPLGMAIIILSSMRYDS